MDGINTITDERGDNKAILLDLIYFKKENIKAEDVLKALNNLQSLIDSAGSTSQKDNNWDAAKEKLNQLKNLE